MGAYNAVNEIPACVNPELLQDILRERWHFKGHVVSDAWALEDVHENHHYTETPEETMSLAIKTGCNLCTGEISKYLNSALEEGMITENEITESVIELYTTRVRLGMFSENNDYDDILYEEIASQQHEQLALKVAEKSIVLLKNDKFLPLQKDKIDSIAVIGPNAASIEALQGNYFGTAQRYTTFLRGIQDELSNHARVYYAYGCHVYNEYAESMLSRKHERESEAIIAAKHSEIVIMCLGLDPTIEGEQGDSGNVYGSGDKPDLRLPRVQERLLKKILQIGKPVIAVIAAGSAISLNGLEENPNLKAIIHTWYPGSHGGTALADIIFGKISPSGKLPVTFYKDTKELPPFKEYAMKNRTYRYFTGEPLYPFGYGLTYSKVDLSELSVTTDIVTQMIQVGVHVINEGNYPVEEVIQVYAKTDAKEEVHNYKLIAFQRVEVAVNDKKKVFFEIDRHRLDVVNSVGEKISKGSKAEIVVGLASPGKRTNKLLENVEVKESIDL